MKKKVITLNDLATGQVELIKTIDDLAAATAAGFADTQSRFDKIDQRFDGIDPSVNPAPALNTAARTEFDNIKREQEMEKQLRLGLIPGNTKKFNPKFTPGG